jgi:archaellum component FlaF (FlaF/FlaG flagellin family)
MNKKILIVRITISFLWLIIIPFIAQAQNETIEFVNPIAYDTIEGVLGSFLSAMQMTIAILCVVFIVIGGIMYMTASGDEKRVEKAKTTMTASIVGFALAVGAPMLLNEIYTIFGRDRSWPSLTLREVVSAVLNLLLSIIGILAIITLVVGGIMYMTSAGEEDRINKAKSIVTYSIIGIAVALAGLVIVRAVATVITGP